MARLLALGLLLVASSAAAQGPALGAFSLHMPDQRRSPAELRLNFETPRIDYTQTGRPERKSGFLAAMQVIPGGFLGVGMSEKKAQRSTLGPDPGREARRGGKKLALKFSLDF